MIARQKLGYIKWTLVQASAIVQLTSVDHLYQQLTMA